MKRIASFEVDHNILEPGMYISRTDGDIITYDLRFIRPNVPPFLENAALHTIEHLFATYIRNSVFAGHIIYFGPMGCRTGFYLLVRGMEHSDAVSLVRKATGFISAYSGDIPGTTARECGNFAEHDLCSAVRHCTNYLEIMRKWTAKRLNY